MTKQDTCPACDLSISDNIFLAITAPTSYRIFVAAIFVAVAVLTASFARLINDDNEEEDPGARYFAGGASDDASEAFAAKASSSVVVIGAGGREQATKSLLSSSHLICGGVMESIRELTEDFATSIHRKNA